jgi:hypothetical protein
LHFERADINAAVHDAIKARATLIVERWGSEVRIACINGWTTRQQLVSERRAAIILQRTKQRIGIDLIAWTGQITSAVITADVVAERCNCATTVEHISAHFGAAAVQNRIY